MFHRADFLALQLNEDFSDCIVVRVIGDPDTVSMLPDPQTGHWHSKSHDIYLVDNDFNSSGLYDTYLDSTQPYENYYYTQWLFGWAVKENLNRGTWSAKGRLSEKDIDSIDDSKSIFFRETDKIQIVKYYQRPFSGTADDVYQYEIPYGSTANVTIQKLNFRMEEVSEEQTGILYGNCMLNAFSEFSSNNYDYILDSDDNYITASGHYEISSNDFGVSIHANGLTNVSGSADLRGNAAAYIYYVGNQKLSFSISGKVIYEPVDLVRTKRLTVNWPKYHK